MKNRYIIKESLWVDKVYAIYDRVEKRLTCICVSEKDAKFIIDLMNRSNE